MHEKYSSKSLKRIGVLGGGIAGLSVSYFLDTENDVLEKESECGGLCRSYSVNGFTYDIGGHIMFSKDTEILDFEVDLMKDNLNKHIRRNTVWFKGRFVKYPFENGIGVLDKEDTFDCLYHFLHNPPRPTHNFEDWIYNTFGSGLANHYLIPYNTKIWKTDPKEMDIHWVERIPKPPVEDVIKSALGIETEGYTHQLYFYYPKTGGFQSLPRAFEAHINNNIIRNFEVKKIHKKNNAWIVSNGHEERVYEKIISTMPMFEFFNAMQDVPSSVMNAVNQLQYTSLFVVLIGLNRERRFEMTSTYFPQPDLLFHRVVFHDYFGKNYVPAGCSSMVAEITARENSALWKTPDEEVVQQVIEGLHREGFLEPTEVITTEIRRIKYAYPIYDQTREKNLVIIYQWCKEQDIELCGRFAEFNYYNSDAVIRSAKTVAERVNEVI